MKSYYKSNTLDNFVSKCNQVPAAGGELMSVASVKENKTSWWVEMDEESLLK